MSVTHGNFAVHGLSPKEREGQTNSREGPPIHDDRIEGALSEGPASLGLIPQAAKEGQTTGLGYSRLMPRGPMEG